MGECPSIAEVSGNVWKNTLALQRLVDMYERMHFYCEVSGYVWKNALLFQRLVDMYGRIH